MNAWLNYVGCGCVALSVLACGAKGDDGDDDDETGGTGGTGTGGSSGTATGGSSGTATGGSSGTATGGSSGSGGAPSMMTYDFAEPDSVCPDPPAANMEGCWKFVNSNADTMAGSTPIPDADIHFQHITDDGDPEMGAFEGTIPYDQPSQWVSFGINHTAQNLTGATITARVKVVSGLGDPMDLMMNPGGSKIYAKSGMTYCYANGMYRNLGDSMFPIGEWHTVTFNLAAPDYLDPMCEMRGEPFNPADIREIGIQFDSNPNIEPLEAVIVIDTVSY